MPSIEFRNICKYVCSNVNFTVPDKDLLVLLGHNGAGKTTLLNIVAGFVDYNGSVLLDGMPIDRVPANKRGIGYVSQDLSLFPHLTVVDNIAYGLKASKHYNGCEVADRVNELMDMMRIPHLASRYPAGLSGGEKQRVALARAMAPSPRVLLLDEPLGGLDTQTSKYLRVELRRIQRKLGITTMYVTHDLTEAEEMADRIVVIDKGHIEQLGRPEEVFFYPASKIVSDFVGMPNILDCAYCHNLGNGVVEVGCGGLPVIVPHDGNSVKRIALFPRDIYISDTLPPGPGVNRFTGLVTSIEDTREMVRLEVAAGDNKLVAELPHHIFEDMDLAVGKNVYLILKLRRIKVHEAKHL
ncbi:MAG: ABC transporter ATP-binding protein [Dehalococcoidales bacterium]|nr:ABC transporter ATP-binding protein [Dehalococcoidales bacterium]